MSCVVYIAKTAMAGVNHSHYQSIVSCKRFGNDITSAVMSENNRLLRRTSKSDTMQGHSAPRRPPNRIQNGP